MKLEIHDNHLPLNAPDEQWIALVGQRQWVALTKDKNIRFRSSELESIRKHAARIVVIRAKNATGPQIAEAVLKGRKQIARFASRTTPPFVARIDRGGTVRPYPGVL